MSSQSLEVARVVAEQNPRAEFSANWGAHCTPGLFFTLCGLLDDSDNLRRSLEQRRQISIADCISAALAEGLFHNATEHGLMEWGGQFLPSLPGSGTDPAVDEIFSLDNPPAVENARIIFANAVFEDGSGIARTLVDGSVTLRELLALFSDDPHPLQRACDYRAQQSEIAACELFAVARNLLQTNGLLVISNVLAPHIVPCPQMLEWLRMRRVCATFTKTREIHGQMVDTSVLVFGRDEAPPDPVVQRVTVPSHRLVDGSLVTTYRTRAWKWEFHQIRADWEPFEKGSASDS